MKNNFEELDTTALLRNELADALAAAAKEDADRKTLERLRRGFFFVPSETLSETSELIDHIEDSDKQKMCRELYNNILEQGT